MNQDKHTIVSIHLSVFLNKHMSTSGTLDYIRGWCTGKRASHCCNLLIYELLCTLQYRGPPFASDMRCLDNGRRSSDFNAFRKACGAADNLIRIHLKLEPAYFYDIVTSMQHMVRVDRTTRIARRQLAIVNHAILYLMGRIHIDWWEEMKAEAEAEAEAEMEMEKEAIQTYLC